MSDLLIGSQLYNDLTQIKEIIFDTLATLNSVLLVTVSTVCHLSPQVRAKGKQFLDKPLCWLYSVLRMGSVKTLYKTMFLIDPKKSKLQI